ncbi:MAG: hypothetical protein ABIU95_05300 [Burkholderiales bacterium]
MTRKDLLPSMGALLWIIALFAGAILLTRRYAAPISEVLPAHARLGILLFFGTTALAVLMPLFSDLPLIPLSLVFLGSAPLRTVSVSRQ